MKRLIASFLILITPALQAARARRLTAPDAPARQSTTIDVQEVRAFAAQPQVTIPDVQGLQR